MLSEYFKSLEILYVYYKYFIYKTLFHTHKKSVLAKVYYREFSWLFFPNKSLYNFQLLFLPNLKESYQKWWEALLVQVISTSSFHFLFTNKSQNLYLFSFTFWKHLSLY